MLFFVCGLTMLATTDAKKALKAIAGEVVVTAACSITRNAAPPPGTETPVKGTVEMKQPIGGSTTMNINISGLPPETLHGFHIHEFGDIATKGELTPLMLNILIAPALRNCRVSAAIQRYIATTDKI
ncbi:superoxide dismutase [Cu-Zn], chloroplastic-like [Orbicella faveolata]|uniref:superoxide dismutase [Cu-Zn], chloroplastic-like n=1 Tax=Orbicella faveolata TaxID=48498 RepID=UPI0009E21C32|nr:superoxide dismutase [Cu-Zn], chloroplastic-like [Orbicella faveolata]